jgi:hypothetical protein
VQGPAGGRANGEAPLPLTDGRGLLREISSTACWPYYKLFSRPQGTERWMGRKQSSGVHGRLDSSPSSPPINLPLPSSLFPPTSYLLPPSSVLFFIDQSSVVSLANRRQWPQAVLASIDSSLLPLSSPFIAPSWLLTCLQWPVAPQCLIRASHLSPS